MNAHPLGLIAAIIVSTLCFSTGCQPPAPFRVMSFNIRNGTIDPPPNDWLSRRASVIATIRENEPDIVGLQEVIAQQADDIALAFPEYHYFGVGNMDGADGGEADPILARRDRFNYIQDGYFWLSDAPSIPGSVGWDARYPRLVSWLKLSFKSNPNFVLLVLNTHLDHVGTEARLHSAEMIRRLTDSYAGTPIVVIGDFNCEWGDPPHAVLVKQEGNLAELRDAFSAKARRGTFEENFDGVDDGRRIDHILHSRRVITLSADIDDKTHNGRYASDHFPVVADLKVTPVSDSGAW
ncbi:MAG: endonuclease/exonuclease/phosphatase family protein [Phycisphaerales bacterium]|nr:endonuclease/exonuclease/phosphatase family protein [Phycisphaerales bacterium]